MLCTVVKTNQLVESLRSFSTIPYPRTRLLGRHAYATLNTILVMEKLRVDFLKQKYELGRSERSPLLFFVRPFVFIIVIAATVAGFFSYTTTSSSGENGRPSFSLFSTLKQFVQSGDRELAGEQDDRVNILLLGVGGAGHDGPQLSDTIILASYQPSSQKMGLLSLPRDMTVPIADYGYQKVNHANAYGERNGVGQGPLLAKQVLSNVLDQDIPYYLRVDFDGFAEFIDDIEGIDVYVDNAFTDSQYPTLGKEDATCGNAVNDASEEVEASEAREEEIVVAKTDASATQAADYSCRFEVLTFTEGWTRMNGDMALKYVRSRHGNNGQGSDFARSRRQQQILLAVKDKLLSASTFLNPGRITRMLDTLENNIATNMSVWELVRLASTLKDLKGEEIVNHVIDASETSPLYATTLNGAFVLLPKNDDWKPLQAIADNIWTPQSEQKSMAKTISDKPLFANVEIQNGTNTTGLAFAASQLVNGSGFNVTKVGNAASRDYQYTVIYDLTNGRRATELRTLKEFLQADVTLSATGWMMSGDVVPKNVSVSSDDYKKLATGENIDFLVILGENASSLVRK